ncbi:MAG TPA: hypothetical protein VGO85_00910 [Caldimonas sp.]|jgi:hypothetical protein|nr:hypothetical protein [Caldimonas sp.]
MTAPSPAADPAPIEPGAKADDDDDDQWRHPPVAPVDERNPLKSLGEAVGETVTGSDAGPPATPKR